MASIMVRFNKLRGTAGRGSTAHVWRVFEDKREVLVKNVQINVSSYGARTGEDWSICCEGVMRLDRDTSTAIIDPVN